MDTLSTIGAAVLAAGILMASGSAPSFAADDSLMDAPEVTISPVASASGVYLRSDIGYAGWRDIGTPMLSGAAEGRFDDARFDRPVSGSIGIGYRVTDILRADLTAERFEGRLSGDAGSLGCGGETLRAACSSQYGADVRATGVMANGYADLANLAGFTAYIGGGVGATYLDWRQVSSGTHCAGIADGCGTASPADGFSSADGWRFTYALMAGASYDLTDRLKLDIGYRYSDIADGTFFKGDGVKGRDDGLSRHEIRAGLRFALY